MDTTVLPRAQTQGPHLGTRKGPVCEGLVLLAYLVKYPAWGLPPATSSPTLDPRMGSAELVELLPKAASSPSPPIHAKGQILEGRRDRWLQRGAPRPQPRGPYSLDAWIVKN